MHGERTDQGQIRGRDRKGKTTLTPSTYNKNIVDPHLGALTCAATVLSSSRVTAHMLSELLINSRTSPRASLAEDIDAMDSCSFAAQSPSFSVASCADWSIRRT